ncbi:DUF4402 domain-containing protein [Halomonas sp.]
MNASTFLRKNFRLTVLASVFAFGAFGASNSFAAEVTAQSTGTVIQPIAISNTSDLAFGKFAPGTTVGTVTINTTGTRSATGGVNLSSIGWRSQ